MNNERASYDSRFSGPAIRSKNVVGQSAIVSVDLRRCEVLNFFWSTICRIQNPDIPRTGRVGAAYGGPGQEGVPGRTGREQIGSPRRRPSLAASRALKSSVLNVSQKNEQAKSYVNRWRNKTFDLFSGSRVLFVSGCWPVNRRLIIFANPFSRKAYLFRTASGHKRLTGGWEANDEGFFIETTSTSRSWLLTSVPTILIFSYKT